MMRSGSRNSNIYSAFAEVYDYMMRQIPYDAWVDHIQELWRTHGFRPEKVLNLACGTGCLEVELAARGLQLTALDQSEAMLAKARHRCRSCRPPVEFHGVPMQKFKLPQKFDMVLCLYDSLNYLLRRSEVERTFRNVFRQLLPGGGFVFDVTTEYNITTSYSGVAPYAEAWEDGAYVWENAYHLDEHICHSRFSFFLPAKGGRGKLFERHIEEHYQKIYAPWELEEALHQTGFEFLGSYHGMTLQAPREDSERIHFVARKPD